MALGSIPLKGQIMSASRGGPQRAGRKVIVSYGAFLWVPPTNSISAGAWGPGRELTACVIPFPGLEGSFAQRGEAGTNGLRVIEDAVCQHAACRRSLTG